MTGALVLAALAAVAAPQEPGTPELGPLASARRALAGGELDAAEAHLLRAFEHGADPGEACAGMLEVCVRRGDEDGRLLWSHLWTAAEADASGRAPTRDVRDLLADDAAVAALARLRAEAVEELADLAARRHRRGARQPHELLVAAWARRLALELAQESPALTSAHREALDPAVHVPRDAETPVLRALDRVMTTALSNGRLGEAIRAARIVHGLGVQADFTHLEGPRPSGMARWRAEGADVLRRAREELRSEHPEPWTVDELEWLTTEEGEAFTRSHGSFADPGVAVSPNGLYRVESDCGYETLLGVASTIEAHHARLVDFYGRDPFEGRPGLVRIVPEASGLESEGAPFFWAGGFQAGDTTVMRFSVGTIEGLGHGLTHELTHRFDGALFPGQPSWLSEGKAVWTGAAYGHSSDESFVPNHCLFGTMESVDGKGFGRAAKLRDLVSGTPEDYRDNYSAGYALYVYLHTWYPPGADASARPFRARLVEFMESGGAPAGDGAYELFVEHFCDGEGGRPASFETFAEGFQTFLRGFYWKDRAKFTERYTQDVPSAGRQPWVYDEPTWVWSWERAEPWFGQDQARRAGELLLELGRYEAALAALVWARAVDGYSPRTHHRIAAALEHEKRTDDAAWVVDAELVFPRWPVDRPAPFADRLRSTRAYVDALADASDAAGEGAPTAARALGAAHDRLARWLGLPERGVRPVEEAGPPRHRLDGPPLLLEGWVDERLTGYDEDRPDRLWTALDDGDLLVGRRSDRTGTGRFDRGGGGRAFARADRWLLPGTYRLRTRVRFTTGFVRGEVVLGYARRDRNVRFSFRAGDFLYSIGEEDEEPTFEEIGARFRGLRVRDAGLPGSARGGSVKLRRASTVFELELLVDGASVTAWVDGRLVGTYHTVDGAPIEGYVGFASSSGAYRVEHPTIERLDRGRLAGLPGLRPDGLDLADGTAPSFHELENLPLFGLPPSTNGTVALWVSMPPPGDDFETLENLRARAERSARNLSERALRSGVVQPVVAIVPAAYGSERVERLREELGALDPPVSVATHGLDGSAPPGADESPDRNRRWVLFVDAAGVVRVVAPWVGAAALADDRLEHWLRVFRDHGAPARELPEVVRYSDEEDDGHDVHEDED